MRSPCLFLAALAFGCTTPGVHQPRADLGEVERSARELGTAWGTRDMATLDALLAADYVHTDIGGHVIGRAAWLDQVRARRSTFAVAFDDVKVIPLGDTALVTGLNRIVDSAGTTSDLRFTQIWIHEGGRWRRRAFQATLSNAAATVPAMYEAEVRAAAKAWAEAIERRDVAAAEQILGAEYALMAPGMGEMPRAQWLANLHDYVVHSYEFTDVKVRVYGETAVMRSHYTQSATVFGKDRSGAMLVTDVWVKRDGRWQVVARHTSFL